MTRYRAFLRLQIFIYNVYGKNCTHQSGHDFFSDPFEHCLIVKEIRISLVPEDRLSWMMFCRACLSPLRCFQNSTPNQTLPATFQTSFHCDFPDFRRALADSFALLRC